MSDPITIGIPEIIGGGSGVGILGALLYALRKGYIKIEGTNNTPTKESDRWKKHQIVHDKHDDLHTKYDEMNQTMLLDLNTQKGVLKTHRERLEKGDLIIDSIKQDVGDIKGDLKVVLSKLK